MKYEQLEGLAQALFEETGDAMFLFDPDSLQLLDANSTAQRLSGFSLRELLHLTVKDLFHSVGEEGLRDLHQATQKTTVFHSREGYFLHTVKEGVRIPVNLTTARLHLKPKTLGLITARDVRKQHEAHAQLVSVEGELRRVMASVSDCLWSATIDESGKCMYHFFSPVVEKIAGLPSIFFLPGIHRWWSVVHPEDQARWTKALAKQRAGQSTQEEYRVVWPDGSFRWVRESVQVSRGTAERGVIRMDGVLTDISERKEVEKALRDSEERFQIFMDNSPTVAFMKDPEGRYLYLNKPFQEFFGKDSGSLLGKTDSELFPPEVVSKMRANDATVLSSNKPLQSKEQIPSPNGETSPWLVIKFPFKDSSGKRLIGGVALPLTDRGPVEASPLGN
jgi:PAS domain S-box-containing protein